MIKDRTDLLKKASCHGQDATPEQQSGMEADAQALKSMSGAQYDDQT